VPVLLSGNSVYPRRIYVNTGKTHAIKTEVIEKASAFHLGFYRELVRGNHPWERHLNPVYRWTSKQPPTFFIDTNAISTSQKISGQTIKQVRKVIKTVLPVFSGGRYRRAAIKVRHFAGSTFDDVPDHAIVISFDDTMIPRNALGIAYTSPFIGLPLPGSLNKVRIFVRSQSEYYQSHTSLELVVAHELGHGFGYRHTSFLPSIMALGRGYIWDLFSEYDRFHMRIVYCRPVGNQDLDNDPISGAKVHDWIPKDEVFVDFAEDFTVSPKLRKRLEALPSRTSHLLDEMAVH
jgi:hypothetical protein